jgi:hypothetical protein
MIRKPSNGHFSSRRSSCVLETRIKEKDYKAAEKHRSAGIIVQLKTLLS